MLRHELIHRDSQHFSFHCSYCEKSFSRKDHLKNHVKVHDPNKELLQCDKCGKQYSSPLAYKTHLAHHAMEQGETTCGVCGQAFDDQKSLAKHLKVHAGARSVKEGSEKTKKCPSCDRLFFTNKDVQRHLVVHTKDRDFMCHLCPLRFGRRDHLVRHMKKSHTDTPLTKLPPKSPSLNLEQTEELNAKLEKSGGHLRSDLGIVQGSGKQLIPSPLQPLAKLEIISSQVAAEVKAKQPKLRRKCNTSNVPSLEMPVTLAQKKGPPDLAVHTPLPVTGSLPLDQLQVQPPQQQSVVHPTELQIPTPQMHILPSPVEPVNTPQPVAQLPLQMLPQILCTSDGGLHIPVNVQIQQPSLLQNLQPSMQLGQPPSVAQPIQQHALSQPVSTQTLSDSAIVSGQCQHHQPGDQSQ